MGDKRKANYFEFAKRKWECEETFRLPDGSCVPALADCMCISILLLLSCTDQLPFHGQSLFCPQIPFTNKWSARVSSSCGGDWLFAVSHAVCALC